MYTVTGMEKIDKIVTLLQDVSWLVSTMMDDNTEDKHYRNLDEVISYLETTKCVIREKSLDYYLERII